MRIVLVIVFLVLAGCATQEPAKHETTLYHPQPCNCIEGQYGNQEPDQE